MSEENRFDKKKTYLIAIVLTGLILGTTTGVMAGLYIVETKKNSDLSKDYDELHIDYLELLIDFNNLNEDFGELENLYYILTGEHVELENDYGELITAYNILLTTNNELQEVFDNLSTEYNSLEIVYNTLLDNYNLLQMEYGILLNNYITLSDDYGELNFLYTSLLNTYELLQIDYNELLIDFNDLMINYNTLSDDFNELQLQYNNLLNNYNTLNSTYTGLVNDYAILESAYNLLQIEKNELQAEYDTLLIAYNYICDTIKQTILPVQYSIFAEAVRRYYMPIYIGNKLDMQYYRAYARFCRDIILHDSGQYNAFSEVSNAFSDALIFGNNTMKLACSIMNSTFFPWLSKWDGYNLTGDELTDITTITNWCINKINYEYDDSITIEQEPFNWDYIKFSVETAFRTMGDCEDQAILCASYLESCGFETTIALIHDQYHGAFYHASILIHITNSSGFFSLYPEGTLWRFTNDPYYPNYTWCWVDPTWDVPFGSIPSWLQYYITYGFSLNTFTLAVCDINGVIIQN